MGLATQIADDLANIEATDSDMAVSFTFGGTSYTAVGITEALHERDMEDAGFRQTRSAELLVRSAAWGNDTPATRGSRLVIDGVNWTVESTEVDQAAAATVYRIREDLSTE